MGNQQSTSLEYGRRAPSDTRNETLEGASNQSSRRGSWSAERDGTWLHVDSQAPSHQASMFDWVNTRTTAYIDSGWKRTDALLKVYRDELNNQQKRQYQRELIKNNLDDFNNQFQFKIKQEERDFIEVDSILKGASWWAVRNLGGTRYRSYIDLTDSDVQIKIDRAHRGSNCHMYASDILAQHLLLAKKYAMEKGIEIPPTEHVTITMIEIGEPTTEKSLKSYTSRSIYMDDDLIREAFEDTEPNVYKALNSTKAVKSLRFALPQFREILDLEHGLKLTEITIGDYNHSIGTLKSVQFDTEPSAT